MTRYCSKKVIVFSLCVITILASLFIGRNIYQGSSSYEHIAQSRPKSISGTELTHRYLQDRHNDPAGLNMTLIRKGGTLVERFKPNDASVWNEGEDGDESSESENDPNLVRDKGDIQAPVVKNPASPVRKFDLHVGIEGRGESVGFGNSKGYSLKFDPRMPRLLRKLVEKLPKEISRDLPAKYRGFKFQKSRDDLMKQWKVISDVATSHGYTQRLPDLINIGVKKSGTNAIGFFVTQHPQISHSLGNEVHFFDRNYDKGLEYYRYRMGFAKKNELIFEKTPKYFVTKDAPAQILKDLPKHVKFLVCVRDPVKRALSDFRHEQELALRRENRMKFRQRGYKTTPEEQGKIFEQKVLDKNGQVNASNVIIDTSYFAKHFKHWLEYFPRDRFLVVDLDTLERGAFHKLKEFEKFAGLPSYFKEDMFYYDKARHGMCMYGKQRPCPAKSTPGLLPKAKPSDATIKKLYDFYRPSNKEFAELAGLDFEWAHL